MRGSTRDANSSFRDGRHFRLSAVREMSQDKASDNHTLSSSAKYPMTGDPTF